MTPVAPRHPSLVHLLGITAVLGTACVQEEEEFSGTLDVPSAVAVLDADVGPFDVPVGYAADRHGGRIRLLDLSTGRHLADTPYASFQRSSALATGDDRLLTHVAAWAPDPDHAAVYALDQRFGALLRVGHIDGRGADGFPAKVAPRVVSTAFDDADGSGDEARLVGITLVRGLATSETFTLVRRAQGWAVEGTRSGPQRQLAAPGVAWWSDDDGVGFVVEGEASEGDRITLTVEAGVDEVLLDGSPVDLAVSSAGAGWVVHAEAAEQGSAHVWRPFDPTTLDLGAPLDLPDDARLSRLAWSADETTLYAADHGRGAVWALDVATGTLVEHPLPWPVSDVAVLTQPGSDDTDDTHLAYVARTGASEVWILDLDTGAFVDVNPTTAAIEGMGFPSPVQGLAALHTPHRWAEPDLDDEPREGRTVAVSLHAGEVVFMEEQTGCLLSDGLGPRTEILSQTNRLGDYEPSFEVLESVTTYLQQTEDPLRHVNVNPCPGLAPRETWTLRHDRTVQGWRVQGTVSGEMARIAYEDERYLSDAGQVSFVLRSGVDPSQEGWEIEFRVFDGFLSANGDNDGDGNREINFDLPGDPAVFTLPDDDGVARPMVVVSAESADFVGRIDPQSGEVDRFWD